MLDYEAENDRIIQAVPQSVAQCNCFYLFESVLSRPGMFSVPPDNQAPLSRLESFVRADEARIGDDVMLHSPPMGYVEGVARAHSLLRCPVDDLPGPAHWIRCHWDYMAQGANQILTDSVSGGLIRSKDMKVFGMFLYTPKTGPFLDRCLRVSVDHLLDEGSSIVS